MNQIFKIMLIGDVSTGKTSFLTQIIYQKAQKMPKPTEQMSFFTLRITCPQTIIQIWDSPGDPRHSYQSLSLLSQFKVVLLFIDITNQHTLNRVRVIIDQLKMYPQIVFHLVETKVDIVQKMKYKRKVTKEDTQRICQQYGGLRFQYHQNQKIQSILERIVQHYNSKIKQKAKRIFNNQNPSKQNQTKELNTNQQFCDCNMF